MSNFSLEGFDIFVIILAVLIALYYLLESNRFLKAIIIRLNGLEIHTDFVSWVKLYHSIYRPNRRTHEYDGTGTGCAYPRSNHAR